MNLSLLHRSFSARRGPVRVAYALVIALSATASLSAQWQFQELRRSHLAADRDSTNELAFGDIDGDGDVDIVSANQSSRQGNRIYLNDGEGFFANAPDLPGAPSGTAVALGDVDGDGDLDIAFGSVRQNRLYLNDGSGGFVLSQGLPADSDITFAIALVDVDADGDPDLLTGNNRRPNRLYLNDGVGQFSDVTATHLPVDLGATTDFAFGDLDGDGDPDLVTANTSGDPCRLALNDGAGRFVRAPFPTAAYWSSSVVLGDVDADGDLDVVLGTNAEIELLLNDGSATFREGSLPSTAIGTGVALGDVDGDGDLDLAGSTHERENLLLNDGSGVFVDVTPTRMPDTVDNSRGIYMADVDGDGDLDLATPNWLGYSMQNRLFLNDGRGYFADATRHRLPAYPGSTTDLAYGDVDGDGDLDLVCSNSRGNALFLNDGSGRFDRGSFPDDPLNSQGVAMGDVDGDGDLDVVVAVGSFSQDRLYLNDGAGVFRDATQQLPVLRLSTPAVALGDLDADGDLDIIFGSYTTAAYAYLNDGRGWFRRRGPSFGGTPVTAIEIVDVDADGDLDVALAVASSAGSNGMFLNDGRGSFQRVSLPARLGTSQSVAAGDVDGDGDVDLVFGNERGSRNQLVLNDGAGQFIDATSSNLPADTWWTLDVALGDVDGDGDLDLVCANYSRTEALYFNDGLGRFTEASSSVLPEDPDQSNAVVLVDIDGDQDLDMLLANLNRDRLFINPLRQIDAPRLARLGRRYDVRIQSQPASGMPLLGVVYLGARRLDSPLPPLGRLRIDPILSLPPVLLSPGGEGVASVTVPSDPSLADASIFAQAVVFDWPNQARLSSLLVDTILR